MKQIDAFKVKPEEIEWSQQVLLTTINGEVSIKFQQLSAKLNNIIKAAELEQQQALNGLHQARLLRLQIIAASMLMSVAIAAILAFFTSRAISQPLETVTKVAQQVTTESNFTLQAPVTTADEIGSLAISLNQLIQWISIYTQELKQAQAQLIQTEKMSSLGQMVAGIAHEINNPVNFIYGNLNHTQDYMQKLLELVALYQQEYPQPTLKIENKIVEIELDYLVEDLPKLLSSMKMGAERIRQIILSLRNFSRLDEAEMKAADLHEGIDNTLLILNNRIKNDIEIVKRYDYIPLVECYPAQLNQVFMNIIANAVDAVLLERSQFLKQIVISTYILDSTQVQVSIRDNGGGIPPEVKAKIFDPFFTTKPVGQGTGLGLAVSYQIIEKHNGKIKVNSEPGKGTEFIVSLPIKSNI